ncbi:hypothetical protein C3L33_06827, partial [Rhododendron williamsianum]
MARLQYGLAPTGCSKMEHFSLCPILVPLQVYYPSFDLRQKQWTDCCNSIDSQHSVKNTLECGRSCNAKAAAVVGEVLAMRLKVEGLEQGQGRGIHIDVNKEVEKKGFKNRTKVSAIVNALKSNGVKLILDEDENGNSWPNHL